MQTAASNSLCFTGFFSLERLADWETAASHGELYQLISSELVNRAYTKQVLRDLGKTLVTLAEHAHASRQIDALEQLSQILVRASLSRAYEDIGRYYQALCIHRFGLGDIEHAGRLISQVAESAPPKYRARAMVSLGASSYRKGDNQSALSLYREAASFSSRNGLYDPYSTIQAQRMVAVINSEEGNHVGSARLLEGLFPFARTMGRWQPHLYYDYMNSLAVELCEVGRLEEARNISQIVLASPLAAAYPEWRETNDEIALRSRRASRSVVAISQWNPESENEVTSETGNLVQLIASRRPDIAETRNTVAAPSKQRASVVNLLEWKNEVNERRGILKDRQTRLRELKKLPTEDKIAEIWGRLGDEDVDDDLLCEALLLLEDYQPEENQGS